MPCQSSRGTRACNRWPRIPDVVERLAGNIQWTTDLGNAFLAQQQDVMDAVQRMRAKAQSKGALKTSQQQTVETKTVEGGKEVIVIQQPNPEVVYVPSYDPAVVYGPPAYPYYPYTYPGYVPGMGLAMGRRHRRSGRRWANNNWGNCNWGGGDININNNNNFNKNVNRNINRGHQGRAGSGNTMPNIAGMHPTVIEALRSNWRHARQRPGGSVARAGRTARWRRWNWWRRRCWKPGVPVELEARAGLDVPAVPVELVARAGLEGQVVPVESEALAALENPVAVERIGSAAAISAAVLSAATSC